jgi:pimeloyl-ACP methyl ester carboxylesterase
MQFVVEGYPAYAYTGGRAFDAKLPAAVFIHGAAFDHSVWQWQSRYLAHHGHGVLALDLPGHGRSPGAIRPSIEAWSDWVAAFLEAAGLSRVALIGHSMGSLIALDTALRHGARLSKLVLVGTASPMPVADSFMAAARDGSTAALDMEAVWGHSRQSQLAQSPVPGTTLLGASRSLNAHSKPGALHAALDACNRYRPSLAGLRALKIPALVVGGKRDLMTAFKSGKALAAEIPGARFVALDAGHSMMSEAPHETLKALRDFLAAD